MRRAKNLIKLKVVFALLALAIIVSSCADDNGNEIEVEALTTYELSVVDYFKDVALGFEFGNASEITRKWTGDMNVFVKGAQDANLLAELERIKNELNQLATDNFEMNIVDSEAGANYIIFFGNSADYVNLYPLQSNLVDSNWGLFSIFWNGNQQLNGGHMYIDIERANEQEQKHLLREELTQSLGLAKDSPEYDDSIFQQEWTRTNEYAQIDRDIIKLLYHPEVSTGLNAIQVDSVLKSILSKN
ncbi:DUF2927 domain-containing protein [Spongiivirga citrea]|uniref:DUF2927 domain-containing protein n=1 Tax=Spongiivirga citrea TaxID=1481457 RepID=A0A6M0CME3_9FLAO|nr:DUF2927 domain-containing protein [Spongiivirga citrea]NER19115.1 DUF2927 domain-containing protein [Spongiivirga citrea]